ncbi:patatin-like phospholipase family protein [Paucibacter sp. M5-1]|uniref:patatin-like phospholipase family protein n=1 Tax=Paucibacter sp. M5-1 TaxID=3015998 RepID=UPI0022B8F0D7|nr:patatin-like phospholipase family protein [Paucibacter sp. M5-1]MCZ7880491.1 patatin-like phospholipase family protein [Paucibacter sp. M5-1]
MYVHQLLWPLAMLLVGCAGAPLNTPKNIPLTASARTVQESQAPTESIVALSFSGGGLRAAAFAFGVLEGLRDQPASANRNLLDEVRFVSSVSGGSLTAAYLGVHGSAGMNAFRSEVLLRDGEAGLRLSLLNPNNIRRMLAGGLNDRTDFGSWLENKVFKGATFADMSSDAKPKVWINATNLQYRLAFPFHQRAFDALCSDLASYPVSEAVAASMAVPLVFAPVVLQRFPESCESKPQNVRAISHGDERDDQYRLRKALARFHRDSLRPDTGRYLKLVDGGITDNLGLVSILQSRVLLDTPYGPIPMNEALTVKRLLFVVVDAGQAASSDWSQEVAGPSAFAIAEGVIDTAIESTMRLSYAGFQSLMRDWERDIVEFRCGLPQEKQDELRAAQVDWRCDEVTFIATQISFANFAEEEERELNSIPTRLSLPEHQIDRLVAAARRAVESDKRIREFSRSTQRGISKPVPSTLATP